MVSSSYELLATKDTAAYQIRKVVLTARYASIVVEEKLGCTPEELQKLLPSAKSLVLRVKSGFGNEVLLTRSNVALRFLAEARVDAGLYGRSPYQSALVDQWLDFSFNSIELPAAVLAATQKDVKGVTAAVKQAAQGEVRKAIGVLDQALVSSTYLAGDQISVADIAVLCATCQLVQGEGAYVKDFPAFGRWLLTLVHQPHVIAVLREQATSIAKGHSGLSGPSRLTPSSVSAVGSASGTAHVRIDGPAGRFTRGRTMIKELLRRGKTGVGEQVVVKGWARSIREGGKGALMFVELTDGSTPRTLQVVLDERTTQGFAAARPNACGGSGVSLSVTGLIVDSPGKGQEIELHGKQVDVVGKVFGGDNGEVGGKYYPMAKKAHSMEYLRSIAHLRSRSKVMSSVMRIRHAMAYATHKFFNDRGFNYVHTPLITGADCEGAGEQFCVTTLMPDKEKPALPLLPTGGVDFSKDFFGRRTCLTVSGQLNVETYACALCDVYTFGPTFRAENSHTTRHLAEFWMIEPEIAFADLEADIALAEDYLKYCVWYALTHNEADLEYFETMPGGETTLRDRLRNVLDNPFQRLTYTAAIELLHKEINAGRAKFEVFPEWGCDLGSEHERYITEKVYKKPVIVTNYPKDIKAFYMRMDEGGKTVSAMDILVPKIGEIIGGSQREERLDVLEQRCAEMGLDPKVLWWYLDLRRYGSVPHAGFGLGFERLILFITGIENIRDVIPFPRFPGHAEF